MQLKYSVEFFSFSANVRDGFNQKVIIAIISQRFDDKQFHFVAKASEKKKCPNFLVAFCCPLQ